MIKDSLDPIGTFRNLLQLTPEQIVGLSGGKKSSDRIIQHPPGYCPGPEFYEQLRRDMAKEKEGNLTRAIKRMKELGYVVHIG